MSSSSSSEIIRFTMLIKRKQDISEEDFHAYWTTKHPAIVSDWLARHGVMKYVQYHTPSSMRALSTKVWTGLGGDHVSDFDGHVELVVPDLQCLIDALEDPYYQKMVQHDEAKFIDAASSFRTVGYEQVYIKDGGVVQQ